MRLTFVDDSLAFDGYSPTSQPLGGPEKALANLTTALAMRGHQVAVFNRCAFPVTVHGAAWHPFEGERPKDTDALIAVRHPRLLEFVATARRKLLWHPAAPEALDRPAEKALLTRHRPAVAFFATAQREQWANPLGLETRIVAAGLGAAYLEDEPMRPAEPPRAIATTHPLARLDWLIRLWVERIRPAAPGAELHVYSALLDKGRLGAELPAAVKPVLAQALEARTHGVAILRPQADPGMAEAYRAARVHLYPGQPGEVLATTLAESQATGLPGVALAAGPAALARVVDGQTGRIATGDGNFAIAAIELLGDRDLFARMSDAARQLQRGRTWAVAAAEFEELCA